MLVTNRPTSSFTYCIYCCSCVILLILYTFYYYCPKTRLHFFKFIIRLFVTATH